MSSRKPVFLSVLDLGLRDVGVTNRPRGFAARVGAAAAAMVGAVVLLGLSACAIVGVLGAGAMATAAVAVGWTAGLFALILWMTGRAPLVVVKFTDRSARKVTWSLLLPAAGFALLALLDRDPVVILPAACMTILGLTVWRRRDLLPSLLRTIRPVLAADETVLGDGLGMVSGSRGGRASLRLVLVTDRRVLVAASADGSGRRAPLIDVPCSRVTRFSIEWLRFGRAGTLSLTLAGADGAPDESHAVTSIVPANLVSIARALQLHGVAPDDPALVSEAERAYEEAKQRGDSRQGLVDRAAMRTRDFDRGMWLLLALAALVLYGPSGVWPEASLTLAGVLVFLALCVGSGYVSRTRSSLAYIVPLNLLVCPAFFFVDWDTVIALMLVLSAVAAVGLLAGSALRGVRRGSGRAAGAAAAPARPAATRGSLRYTIGGRGLIRISAPLLGALAALVVTATAAGLEPSTLRLAVQEATLRQLPVDGSSNLSGGAASIRYPPGPDLREFITDESGEDGPNDGAGWELRSSFLNGYNVVSLSHHVFKPPLDNPSAVASFVARKGREHARLAGRRVTVTRRVVDGRRGYVWTHGSSRGYWFYSAWFPHPVHSVRVECIAKRQEERFGAICAQALRSLRFDSRG